MFVKYADGSIIPKLEYPKRASPLEHPGKKFPRISNVPCAV